MFYVDKEEWILLSEKGKEDFINIIKEIEMTRSGRYINPSKPYLVFIEKELINSNIIETLNHIYTKAFSNEEELNDLRKLKTSIEVIKDQFTKNL